ncbi:hypothetical protein [Fodinicola acaciae]|uniref:hypothetical protein n=1 Tax=Fodinicola acaciae TaxID=2681555 RepID=UPI0013D14076|nr:hypothetical protein [Fodinicola acaciae]
MSATFLAGLSDDCGGVADHVTTCYGALPAVGIAAVAVIAGGGALAVAVAIPLIRALSGLQLPNFDPPQHGAFAPAGANVVVQQLGADAANALLDHMSGAEVTNLLRQLGADRLRSLAAKFGGDVLKHYGPEFFTRYEGVTADTMSHLLTNDGIQKGKIKGCHDMATFQAVLNGRGQIVNTVAHPSVPGVVRYEYKLFKRNSDGSFVVDASGQPQLKDGLASQKTVIDGLAADTDAWQDRFNHIADESIRSKNMPKEAAGGPFTGAAGGLDGSGYIREFLIKTIFVDF